MVRKRCAHSFVVVVVFVVVLFTFNSKALSIPSATHRKFLLCKHKNNKNYQTHDTQNKSKAKTCEFKCELNLNNFLLFYFSPKISFCRFRFIFYVNLFLTFSSYFAIPSFLYILFQTISIFIAVD
jgi:hypothetical protein